MSYICLLTPSIACVHVCVCVCVFDVDFPFAALGPAYRKADKPSQFLLFCACRTAATPASPSAARLTSVVRLLPWHTGARVCVCVRVVFAIACCGPVACVCVWPAQSCVVNRFERLLLPPLSARCQCQWTGKTPPQGKGVVFSFSSAQKRFCF